MSTKDLRDFRMVKVTIIFMTICWAVVHILEYDKYRNQSDKYFETELKRYGFDKYSMENVPKIVFNATIIFAIMFNITYIILIVKEILVGVFIFSLMELTLLIFNIPEASDQPIMESMFVYSYVGIAFWFSYLLRWKQEEEEIIEVEPWFPAPCPAA